MVVPDPSPSSTPDPFLSLSIVWFRLPETAYTDPVSLENPDYVHTVALWPGFLLMTDAKWPSIETNHGVPGDLLQAFERALRRDFRLVFDQQSVLIDRLLAAYKRIAETTIFHEKSRGAEILVRRLKNAVEEAQSDMTLLLAARTEAELGPSAGRLVRQSQQLESHRFPSHLRRLLPKIEKDLGSLAAPKKTGTGNRANVCEYCKQKVTGGFEAHNLACPEREKAKGVHAKKRPGTPSPAAPEKENATKKKQARKGK